MRLLLELKRMAHEQEARNPWRRIPHNGMEGGQRRVDGPRSPDDSISAIGRAIRPVLEKQHMQYRAATPCES